MKKEPRFRVDARALERFRVDARALEKVILERGFDIESFRRACRIHPATMRRLLGRCVPGDGHCARRDFRAQIVRLLLRHLKVGPERVVVDELSEEDRKNLAWKPPATKRNYDLKRQYEKDATGGKPTIPPVAARRRDLRRHGSGTEEVA